MKYFTINSFLENNKVQDDQVRQKRRSRKVIIEKVETPPKKTVEERKTQRESILTKLCLANPKFSNVIKYHEKILKGGVYLVN